MRMLQLPLQLRFVLLLIFQFQFHSYPSLAQQQYRKRADCDGPVNQYKGYICNGPQKSCQSYLTFRSHPPYDSPIAIANLMASEASAIASINQVAAESYIFPPEALVTVPVSCSCWGNNYLHNASYTIQKNQTYSVIANNTYQGLTTCPTNAEQNVTAGAQITVLVTCACPSYEQAANKVSSLLVYMIGEGDSLYGITMQFGVSVNSLLDANNLTGYEFISPFTPLLVPLQNTSCFSGQRNFLCKPSPPSAHSVRLVTVLGICISIGFMCLFFISYCLYQYHNKRRHRIRKQKLFMRNGGHLLQKRLGSDGGSGKLKLFTTEELETATNNYSKSRFLGQGAYGNVYKRMLLNGTIVAVKRSKTIDKSQIEQFINEVVILSQINHRNVVKLFGSCLETEFPLLVYEFVPNGPLSSHIHCQHNESSCLTWDVRLMVACEVAGAVAYMHSAASIPIFHRDIKSSNILLDEKYRAKVSDFGTSRVVPCDKTHLTTAVQGTFGYLDPEYFQSSQFTDKSDVYSFGVVLVELLTGQKPISLVSGSEDINIVSHFISLIKEDRLQEVLDTRIAGEVSKREVVAIGNLTKRCLRLNGKKRPSMKEVVMGLENLMMKSHTYREPEASLREGEFVSDSDDENDEMRQIFEESLVESFVEYGLDLP